MGTQRLIADLDAERACSHRLELQIGALLEQVTALTQRVAELTERLGGILVSDRAAALSFWAMERRQICWAQVLRKYVSFSERAGPAGELGRQLLDYTGLLFDYWHDYKAGALDRATYLAWMAPVRAQVEAVLSRAAAPGAASTASPTRAPTSSSKRLMTVARTARKQRKDVLAFLTACCQAQLDGTRAPSLFAAA